MTKPYVIFTRTNATSEKYVRVTDDFEIAETLTLGAAATFATPRAAYDFAAPHKELQGWRVGARM